MLAVEDRFMIKDLHRKGMSISDIARQTGHDRKTVHKALDEPLMRSRWPMAQLDIHSSLRTARTLKRGRRILKQLPRQHPGDAPLHLQLCAGHPRHR